MKWDGKTEGKTYLGLNPQTTWKEEMKWQICLHVFERSQVWKPECSSKAIHKEPV